MSPSVCAAITSPWSALRPTCRPKVPPCGRVGMAQNGAPIHETERQGRWKQDGGMVGRYTRSESAGSALRYL